MSFSFENVDLLIDKTTECIEKVNDFDINDKLYVGVDLGTAYIVLVVVDSAGNPIATELQYAEVVRDGLVVDYSKACSIVRELKEKLENRLGVELVNAAIAMPPGVNNKSVATHRYVAESAGFEVLNVIEEPEAANNILNISSGVVVDVGGGTTGIAIFNDGKMVYTADEPTGGTHFTLTIAGNYGITFNEAENKKKDKNNTKEIFRIVLPVIQKVGSIINKHIKDYNVDLICLVGGTVCLDGFENVVEKETNIRTIKPKNPFLVTPLGIAMSLIKKEE
ncbi:ethanolamine utilization protein EutJ [uncultured Brachyspira sp.]|uniref:ethanolamine utilization protein EutJ n=1 Tax=uncultured Brachyspira sp. TaxID=221953 RepID=UPI002623B3C6|nr:ethanolamine utilization protein EutJ [uncultured Brachyspira sp.]